MTRAAAAFIDERGARALTLAELAAGLGVAPPSLYKHVGGLDDLLERVALLATREFTAAITTAALGRSGSEALRSVADAYRAFATRHPGLYPLTQTAPGDAEPDRAEAASESVAVITAALAGYGVVGTDMVDVVRTVRAALHGFVDLERSSGFGMPRSVDGSFAVLVDALDAALLRLGRPGSPTGTGTPESQRVNRQEDRA
ncbi:TetR/AcrR family transcriptional regulator [Curtobacterium sp. Leaf261]|uniref:TetR/AcrR family transcriptional regulator n=1 Tax=Curtobacterium sp. Leaf261 TaxID=1736311 RepID=UPI001F2B9C57|nr:TetR/AcrR family transcriptional regulator [Curtobacterium sp. Leaf261]